MPTSRARLVIAHAASIDARAIGGVASALYAARGDHEAAIVVAPIVGESIALGAFQRRASTIAHDYKGEIVARSAGGVALTVASGQVLVALDLASPGSLGGVADAARGLNRHVRPLLRALTKVGLQASFGGRDVVRARRQSIACLGARHTRSTENFGLEAIVALDRDFAVPAHLDLAWGDIAPRFGGAAPSSIARVAERAVDMERLRDAIVDAFALAADRQTLDVDLAAPAIVECRQDAPFDALIEAPIGLIGAACEGDRVRLGGDFMLSDDVLDALHAALDVASDAEIDATIDVHLGPRSGAMLIGVRDLSAFARLVRIARTKMQSAQVE